MVTGVTCASSYQVPASRTGCTVKAAAAACRSVKGRSTDLTGKTARQDKVRGFVVWSEHVRGPSGLYRGKRSGGGSDTPPPLSPDTDPT